MNLSESVQAWLIAGGSLCAILAGLYAFVVKLRPWWRNARRDYVAGRDALVGRDAVVDTITGKELAPALPGIGQRMANVETAIVAIATQSQDIADLKDHVAANTRDIAELKQARAERLVSHAESAQAWRAMEAAAKAQPDEVVE